SGRPGCRRHVYRIAKVHRAAAPVQRASRLARAVPVPAARETGTRLASFRYWETAENLTLTAESG
ncbi:MAG: hypothetical protein AB7I32_16545, partial [Gammaproteobacteria bacterium]